MKRILIELALVSGTLLSLVQHSVSPVSADCWPIDRTLGTCLDEQGVIPWVGCSLGDVNASGGDVYPAYDVNVHGYSFSVYCPPSHAVIDPTLLEATTAAQYNTRTHEAQEWDTQLLENANVYTSYLCDADPWIAEGVLSKVHPTCTRTAVNANGPASLGDQSAFAGGYVTDDPTDFPWSAAVISDHSRHVLHLQLDNVLNRPTPTPPPSLQQKVNAPTGPAVSALAPSILQTGSARETGGLASLVPSTGQDPTLITDVTSPTANQVVHDVVVNAQRHASPTSSDRFELEWSFDASGQGAWTVAPVKGAAVLDKATNQQGLTVPFAAYFFATTSRNWRVRARLIGVSGATWSSYVQFQLQ